MKLYWVTTDDHGEDWFVTATSPEEASKYHETMEGYDYGEAKAVAVIDIPDNINAEIGWPSDELLLTLGAKLLMSDPSRVVEIFGRKFCEGLLEATINEISDDLFEKNGEVRLNRTKKSSLQ